MDTAASLTSLDSRGKRVEDNKDWANAAIDLETHPHHPSANLETLLSQGPRCEWKARHS